MKMNTLIYNLRLPKGCKNLEYFRKSKIIIFYYKKLNAHHVEKMKWDKDVKEY